jgi:tape measure domain-containing protein
VAERTTKVRISAQIQEYVAGMEKVAQTTREAGTSAEKLAQKKEAFQTLGAGAAVLGGAMTALTFAVAKTGIEYNTLQQTSRAALTTLLGSAEAANAQMDKLDEFARTSPFSKATFITAQQQMLAFGIEAKKVVPYLDAIGEAVAAAGGSNQEIAEIAFIMAQISSAGKITAQDLMQFGQRGVNAAEIIGSQMGKTGAEIRQQITAGTLGADQALDALAGGMKEKFDGASANVKETFVGALDRVKAAWRDLSADLMKPLVDPNGGGALVDFMNEVANFTRTVQALPEPVKIAGGAVFALTGLTLLAGGAFIAAVPKVAAYNAAISTLGGGAQRASRLLGTLAKGAGAAVGFLALAKGAEAAAKAMGQMGDGAKTANETLSLLRKGDYDGIFDGIVPSVEGLGDAFDKLLSSDPGDAFNRWGSDVFAFTGLTSDVGESRKQFALLGDALAGLVDSGDGDRAASIFEEIKAKAKEQGYSVEQLNEIMPQYQDALLGVENDALAAADSTDVATDAFGEQAGAALSAEDALSAMKAALDGIAGSAMSMSEAHDAALSSINSLVSAAEAEGVTLDGTNDASIKFRDSLRDVEQAHRDSAVAILENGGTLAEAQGEWERGRQAVIDMRVAKGEDIDTAAAWADANLGTASEVVGAMENVTKAINNIPKHPVIDLTANTADAYNALMGVQDMLRSVTGNHSLHVSTGQGGQGGITFAAGGLVEAFAGGGMEPGIYPYTPGGIHKFAEEYAEGYVSMDPRRRDKSEGVWNAIGNRMGFSGGSGSSGPVSVSLAGAQMTLMVDGNPIRAVVHEQLVAYDDASERATRGRLR